LPTGYDSGRAYPVVYQLHGCSDADRQNNNVPVERESDADAINVRGKAAGTCWDTNPTGADVAYVDAMMAAVEAQACVNTARRYVTGYSSGSFMAHRIACLRSELVRGVATIGGGQAERDCAEGVGALLLHDSDDPTVNISA